MPKVTKRDYKTQIPEKTLTKWKMASFYGMYAPMVEETGIMDYVLRDAMKHGIGTKSTVDKINAFFDKREKEKKKEKKKIAAK